MVILLGLSTCLQGSGIGVTSAISKSPKIAVINTLAKLIVYVIYLRERLIGVRAVKNKPIVIVVTVSSGTKTMNVIALQERLIGVLIAANKSPNSVDICIMDSLHISETFIPVRLIGVKPVEVMSKKIVDTKTLEMNLVIENL